MTDISTLLLAGWASGWEIWIILFIILILFGSRLPGIARSLGQGINQFKKGLSDTPEEEKPAAGTPAPKAKVEETKPS